MGNVVYLAANGRTGAARDLRRAATVTTEAADQLLAAAKTLEANIDLLDSVVEQIEDPILREA